jgi:sialate O-acetylesterase
MIRHLGMGALAVLSMTAAAHAAFTDFTGFDGGGWQVDYQLHIANGNNFSGGVPYDTNNSGTITTGSFNRVAYVMEVQSGTGPTQFVFASFDPQSNNASLLGVPSFPSGELYQQNVNNLHVLAGGGATVTTGVFASGSGNIEFWPTNYAPFNAAGIPGASNDVFDSGDQDTFDNNYGSMQIHNHNTGGANEVLIAFNQWNGGGGELGIGNNPSGQPDWTFSNNAGSYTVKDLQVLVKFVPEPASLSVLGLGGLTLLARRRRA